uniref:hypothetical protein n=1 Tax=Nocardia asiatica TaxID=209252 RepID=UPI002454D809
SQKGDDVSGSGAYTHMTMVAENATGLRNLFMLWGGGGSAWRGGQGGGGGGYEWATPAARAGALLDPALIAELRETLRR